MLTKGYGYSSLTKFVIQKNIWGENFRLKRGMGLEGDFNFLMERARFASCR